MKHLLHTFAVVVLVAVLACGVSCRSFRGRSARRGDAPARVQVKSLVAVAEFDDKSGFRGKWDLPEEMAALLTTALLESGRFRVVDSGEDSGVFEDLIEQGRHLLKRDTPSRTPGNRGAHYVVRGTITDFTVLGDDSDWFSSTGPARRKGKSRARVALTVRVADTRAGELVLAVSTEKTVSAALPAEGVNYRKMAFGGDEFFRTPLGRATRTVITRAVKEIVDEVPVEYWHPRVAEAGPDHIVINGGDNVGVQEGDIFLVREAGRDITDPVDGHVIDTVGGRVKGKAKVVAVKPLAAHAVLVEGNATHGASLDWIPRR